MLKLTKEHGVSIDYSEMEESIKDEFESAINNKF